MFISNDCLNELFVSCVMAFTFDLFYNSSIITGYRGSVINLDLPINVCVELKFLQILRKFTVTKSKLRNSTEIEYRCKFLSWQ